jgi:hypothetical protein
MTVNIIKITDLKNYLIDIIGDQIQLKSIFKKVFEIIRKNNGISNRRVIEVQTSCSYITSLLEIMIGMKIIIPVFKNNNKIHYFTTFRSQADLLEYLRFYYEYFRRNINSFYILNLFEKYNHNIDTHWRTSSFEIFKYEKTFNVVKNEILIRLKNISLNYYEKINILNNPKSDLDSFNLIIQIKLNELNNFYFLIYYYDWFPHVHFMGIRKYCFFPEYFQYMVKDNILDVKNWYFINENQEFENIQEFIKYKNKKRF